MTPLAPAGLPARPAAAGRRGWLLGVSVLLHLLLLAALLSLTRRPKLPPQAPSYELVFEGQTPAGPKGGADAEGPQTESPQGQPTPPESAAPPAALPTPAPAPAPVAPQDDAPPGPATMAPTTPPQTEAPDAPAASAAAPPVPTPPAPTPDASLPAPATPAPAPPPVQMAMQDQPAEVATSPTPPATAPAPLSRTTPDIRLAQPSAPPPPLPLPDFTPPVPPPPLPLPPLPPPPLPALPRPPAPPPAARPRTAPAAPSIGSLSSPLDLNFHAAAPRGPAARVGAATGSVASRSIDLSTGTARSTPNRQEAFFDERAKKLGADWMEGVRGYWLRHRYYPIQAAENGESGTAEVELTVNRYGVVQSAVIVSKSGSAFLDMAAVGTFRAGQLPPLPEEVEAPYKVTLTINYYLIR